MWAQKFDDDQFMELVNQIEQDLAGKGIKRPPSFPENYYGQFYTVKSGYLSNISMWQQLRQSILDSIAADPQQRAKDVLDYLLNQPSYTADFAQFKARFEKFRNALDTLLRYGLVKKDTVRDAIRYSLYANRGTIRLLNNRMTYCLLRDRKGGLCVGKDSRIGS